MNLGLDSEAVSPYNGASRAEMRMYDKIAYEMFMQGFTMITPEDVEDYLRKGVTSHLTHDEIEEIESLLEVFNQ